MYGRGPYAQTGAKGVVDEFGVGADGSLAAVGSVTVPGAVGGEGIAAGWSHPSPAHLAPPVRRTRRKGARMFG
jgi:hypothetical protein